MWFDMLLEIINILSKFFTVDHVSTVKYTFKQQLQSFPKQILKFYGHILKNGILDNNN